MSERLATVVALYGGFLAVWALGAALARRDRGPTHLIGVLVLELAVGVQAVLDVVGLAGGHRPAELPVHLGYVLASVVVLPVAVGASPTDEGRWASAVVAVGCLATAVVALRLAATWPGDVRT